MDGEPGIVWLVDGREVPFDEEGAAPRTWLEESASWITREGSDTCDPPDRAGDEKPPELLWI